MHKGAPVGAPLWKLGTVVNGTYLLLLVGYFVLGVDDVVLLGAALG